jgi:hypothetical protein
MEMLKEHSYLVRYRIFSNIEEIVSGNLRLIFIHVSKKKK